MRGGLGQFTLPFPEPDVMATVSADVPVQMSQLPGVSVQQAVPVEQVGIFRKIPPPTQQPMVDYQALAKMFRPIATWGFPFRYRINATGQVVWASPAGAAGFNKQPGTYTYLSLVPRLLTAAQRDALASFDKPKADYAGVSAVLRFEPTQGFPVKFVDTRLNRNVWSNNVNVFSGQPRYKFAAWETHLATPQQNDAWTKMMEGTGSQGSAPVPIVGDPAGTIVDTAMVDDSASLRTPITSDPLKSASVTEHVAAAFERRYGADRARLIADQAVSASTIEAVESELAQMSYRPDGRVVSETALQTGVDEALMIPPEGQAFLKKWGLPLGIGVSALVLWSLIR